MKEKSIITDIQRYCIHDGDGIRTTVFFKGCPLHCLWCHNPETQNPNKELLDQVEKCTGCGVCMEICPEHAVAMEPIAAAQQERAVTDRTKCMACQTCVEYCVSNLREISGKEYSVKQLFDEICKDEMFYQESGGGVTLSGGEVMTSNLAFLEELLKKLKRYGITVTIDTCGYTSWERFERILPYVDTFLYDVKLIDDVSHQKYTGVSNTQILSNLEKLSIAGAKIYIRVPVIVEVNGNITELGRIVSYLKDKQINPAKICLLPYHNTGSAKYERLGGTYPGEGFTRPSEEAMEDYVKLFQTAGFKEVQIGG